MAYRDRIEEYACTNADGSDSVAMEIIEKLKSIAVFGWESVQSFSFFRRLLGTNSINFQGLFSDVILLDVIQAALKKMMPFTDSCGHRGLELVYHREQNRIMTLYQTLNHNTSRWTLVLAQNRSTILFLPSTEASHCHRVSKVASRKMKGFICWQGSHCQLLWYPYALCSLFEESEPGSCFWYYCSPLPGESRDPTSRDQCRYHRNIRLNA